MQILYSGKNSTKNPVTLSLPNTGLVHEYSPAEVKHFVHNLHYRDLPQPLDLWCQVLLLLPCSLPWMECLLTFLHCHFAELEMTEGTTGMSLYKKNLTVAIFQLVLGLPTWSLSLDKIFPLYPVYCLTFLFFFFFFNCSSSSVLSVSEVSNFKWHFFP